MTFFRFFRVVATPKTANYKFSIILQFLYGGHHPKKLEKKLWKCVFIKYINKKNLDLHRYSQKTILLKY